LATFFGRPQWRPPMNEQTHEQAHEPIDRNDNDIGADAGRPVSKRLHAGVYGTLIGLALWLIMSVWLFAGGGVTDYLLFIVSGFIVVAVGLPFILSRVGRNGDAATSGVAQRSFRDWAANDFDTWQGRLQGREAALQILLPIAAVAIGMTIFGVAFHVAEHKG